MPDSMDADFGPRDDLRHWPPPGGRMRDSLSWQLMIPEERLGLQIHLYLTDRGTTAYDVSVWGPGTEPVALKLAAGTVGDDMDLDDFHLKGLSIKQPELGWASEVSYRSAEVNVDLHFTGLHDAFSYRSNPDGLPGWFAVNRVEQTGRVTGFLEVGDRRLDWDRIGHRNHSWGTPDWGMSQHWKWFVAYTPTGRVVNGWIWIARGEWGFAGYVLRDGKPVAVSQIDHKAAYHDDMTQRGLTAEIVDVDGHVTWLELDCFGVVELPTKDPTGTVCYQGACEARIDGEKGAAQFETHWHGSYLAHLIGNRT